MIMLATSVDDDRTAAVRPLGALDVVVRRNAFGRQVDSFETDLDFQGISDPVHAVFIRAPWVEKIGAGVSVLATVPEALDDATTPDATEREGLAGRIVAVQQGAVLATAFHPELVEGDERVHRYFVRIVRGR
jgi:pyridoxal 5'-phosphate synthase pdxT subunit